MVLKNTKLPPHWTSDGKVKRCSVCGYPFPPEVRPSIDTAFAEHLRKAHQPGQISNDFRQATVRDAGKSTDVD
jgi:hypothetical protein